VPDKSLSLIAAVRQSANSQQDVHRARIYWRRGVPHAKNTPNENWAYRRIDQQSCGV